MPLCCDALARIHRRAAMSSEGNGNSSAKDVPCEDEETSLSFSSWPRGASHGQRDTQKGSSEVAVPLVSLTSFATSKPRREAAGFFRVRSSILRSYQVSMTLTVDLIAAGCR